MKNDEHAVLGEIQPSSLPDQQTQRAGRRRLVAERVALAGAALGVLAIVSGIAAFLSIVADSAFDPFQLGMVGFAVLGFAAGIVALALKTERRTLAGSAIGIGIGVLLIPGVFVADPFFDPFQLAILTLLCVSAGIVVLAQKTRRRALAGAAIGIGIVVAAFPAFLIVMALIDSQFGQG